MSEPRFGLRTAALVAAVLVGVVASAYSSHEDRTGEGQIWLLPYESGR